MNFVSYRLFLKALSNEGRFEIVQALRHESFCVTEICQKTGLKQSRVSRSLECLQRCGFVTPKRNGKRVYYALDEKTIVPMLNLIDKHIDAFSQHLKTCNILGDKAC